MLISTEVGERGITLSGGQKQRISLAHVIYSKHDIVVMDDPMSAVDPQVGQHLLHSCIVNGPLKDKTRILVTHQLDALPYADMIIVMDSNRSEGRFVQQGIYEVSSL